MGMPTSSLHWDASTGVGVGHLDSQHTQAHDDLPKIRPLGLGGGSGFTPRRGLYGQLAGHCRGRHRGEGPAMAITANQEHKA